MPIDLSEGRGCPTCGAECVRDEVDIGVGIQYGPWACPNCGWSEDGNDAIEPDEENPGDPFGEVRR